MGFIQDLQRTTQKHLRSLQDAHDRRVRAAEERARTQVAKARTKTEREKAKLQLQREKLALKQELYEAKTATNKAKAAMEKARKESGDIGAGGRFEQAVRSGASGLGKLYRGLAGSPSKRKRVVKRKTVARKTVRR